MMKEFAFFTSAHADASAPPVPGSGGQTTASTQVATPAGAPSAPSPIASVLPLAMMIGVVYFLMIRPQQKKMKAHQAVIEKIQHGDEVVTASGIFGKVTGVTPKVLTLEIADGVRVKMMKSQVASVNPKLE